MMVSLCARLSGATNLMAAALTIGMLVAPKAAVADNAKFTFLRTVSVAELNQILDQERTEFLKIDEVPLVDEKTGNLVMPPGYTLPAPAKASNAVDLYTVQYDTTVPERNNQRVRVSGLLALPRLNARSRLPLMAYQHGTVYNAYGVPSYAFQASSPAGTSHRAESWEDRYMVALFGGNGYAVMAADLVGLGADTGRNPEGYMIKGVSTQANLDLYRDVLAYLASNKIEANHLFLGGWSQGGFNTTSFLEKLEGEGIKVNAAFTAAAPNDVLAAVNAGVFHPLPSDTKYFAPFLAQTAFACEAYGGSRGLARQTLEPTIYDGMRSFYERTYKSAEELNGLMDGWRQIERRGRTGLLNEPLRNPAAFAASAYGQCLARNEVYRWNFQTDLRMYYGSIDPIVRPPIARLAAEYQLAAIGTPQAGAQSKVVAIPVEGGTHRLAFITGSVEAKAWMDQRR